jgi:hypothetical protein
MIANASVVLHAKSNGDPVAQAWVKSQLRVSLRGNKPVPKEGLCLPRFST